jgi:hypothetical protein
LWLTAHFFSPFDCEFFEIFSIPLDTISFRATDELSDVATSIPARLAPHPQITSGGRHGQSGL